ncbi:UvrD-helicase domain-containing protein [Paenibacillus sp. F411]|nr:UvrD-helicase domain-containing protein [Paenibacillus sp. F411]
MSKPEGSMWSDDQWQAIMRSGNDILVAAAAGSGKTAVLVERIIKKVINEEAGFSVDRLLVATFTKAAAAEMRQRIREALERELEKAPDREHLRRQLAMLGRASITTLHSFCMEVIRRYYQLIPLDPGFRILNEHEADLLRQDVLEELFEEKYGDAEHGGEFLRLADWFSGERSDDALYQLVQRLYDFSRSHPWPDEWLRDTAAAFSLKDTAALGATPWVKSILADARLALAGAASLLEQAKEAASAPGGPAAYMSTLEDDLQLVHALSDALHSTPWEELYAVFQQGVFGKLKAVKKSEVLPELQERVKNLRDLVKKIVTELKTSLFGRTAEQFLEELHASAPVMEELVDTVIAFAERYRHAKASKSTVDFNDLEHYCLQILRHEASTPGHTQPSDAALEYQSQFDEVLLDEYQDTNSVQEEIVRLISREGPGNRFMVGDVKQSIVRP